MTPEEIQKIRQMRAYKMPWRTIARWIGKTVEECRAAVSKPAAK